jgi:alpha-1,3-glucan synthase
MDHRDPTHPVHNIIKAMYTLRTQYPVLNDGFAMLPLSKQTHNRFLPGSNMTPTETGMWSTVRVQYDLIQDLAGESPVWLVYQNEDHEVTYQFNCEKEDTALFAPFPVGSTVKNLLAPYEELTLQRGSGKKFFVDKSQEANGCLPSLKLDPWAFKAFVLTADWRSPTPVLTKFVPGHDARIPSASTVEVCYAPIL